MRKPIVLLTTLALTLGSVSAVAAQDVWDGADELPTNPLACPGGEAPPMAPPGDYDGGTVTNPAAAAGAADRAAAKAAVGGILKALPNPSAYRHKSTMTLAGYWTALETALAALPKAPAATKKKPPTTPKTKAPVAPDPLLVTVPGNRE